MGGGVGGMDPPPASLVCVDPLSSDPTAFWKERVKAQKVMRFKVKTPREPPAMGKVSRVNDAVVRICYLLRLDRSALSA